MELRLYTVKNGQIKIEHNDLFFLKEFSDYFKEYNETALTDPAKHEELYKTLLFIDRYANKYFKENIFAALNDFDREALVKEIVGLHSDWKVTDRTKKAIDKYIEIQLTLAPSLGLLHQLEQDTLEMIKDIALSRAYTDAIKEAMQQDTLKLKVTTDEAEREKLIKNIGNNNKSLMDSFASRTKLAAAANTQLEMIRRLKTEVLAELDRSTNIRGGGRIGNREDILAKNSLLELHEKIN